MVVGGEQLDVLLEKIKGKEQKEKDKKMPCFPVRQFLSG